jgi:hypothetical protein
VAILIVALLAAVVFVVGAPLRAAARAQRSRSTSATPEPMSEQPEPAAALERNELEAARAAKYREIRDAELDFRTGKLSSEDYAAIDRDLRAEAIEILNRLEALDARTSAE